MYWAGLVCVTILNLGKKCACKETFYWEMVCFKYGMVYIYLGSLTRKWEYEVFS